MTCNNSRLVRVGLTIILTIGLLGWGPSKPNAQGRPGTEQAQTSGGIQLPGVSVEPVSITTVNFAELARDEQERQVGQNLAPQIGIVVPWLPYEEPQGPLAGKGAPTSGGEIEVPNVPSPSPSASFQGLNDIPQVGGFFSFIPPDTNGAVGPTRIFNTLNNNYRVLDKATGATISTVSMWTFWAGTGAVQPFDPKTVYDPYNGRFIVSAVTESFSASSSILIGISATSDPNGAWTLFRYLGCPNASFCGGTPAWWADYPELGFNKNWAALTVNMFGNTTGAFQASHVWVFNYATLLSGVAPPGNVFVTGDFTVVPVVTYSSTENTLYAPTHFTSAGASYRLNTITGTPAAPVYTTGALKTHTLIGAWTPPGGDIVPQ
jgi:hypothetical protein